jgi:O-antigen/teichoic acid export membrane protein
MAQKTMSIRKFFVNSLVYATSSTIQGAMMFLMLPIYTRFLTPSEYGTVSIVVSLTTVVSILSSLALESAISRFYFEFSDKNELKVFNSTIIIFVIGIGIIVNIFIILTKNVTITSLIQGIDFIPYILLGVLTATVKPAYTIYQVMLQVRQKAFGYATNVFAYAGLTVILNVVFIIIFNLKAIGILLTNFIVVLLFSAYAIIRMYKFGYINFYFNKKYIPVALKYSLPIIPHSLSSNIAVLASKSILNTNMNISSVGIFDIASQFGLIVDTAQQAVNKAYSPYFFECLKKEDRTSVIRLSEVMMKFYCVVCVILALFSREVVAVFASSRYQSAWMLVPIIAIAYQIKGAYYLYVNSLFYSLKGTKYIFIGTVGSSILNIFSNTLLIGELGNLTPAVSLLISNIILVIIIAVLSCKIEPIRFNIFSMLAQFILGIVVIAVGLYFDYILLLKAVTIISILIKVCLLFGVIILLFYKERNTIYSMIKSLHSKILQN